MHLSERARVDQPLVQGGPTHTERILETLIRASTVTMTLLIEASPQPR